VVIDGKQRISTLQDFLNQEDLDASDRRAVQNYKFSVVEYSKNQFKSSAEDDVDVNRVVDFFYKTNSLGAKPNAQEIRRAKDIKKPYVRFAKKAANTDLFRSFLDLVGVSDRDYDKMRLRFFDEEFILKTMAYFYTENLDRSLYAGKIIEDTVSLKSKKELEADFKDIFGTFLKLYEGFQISSEFHFGNKYKGLMPLVLGIISQYSHEDIENNQKAIRKFLEDFWVLSTKDIAKKYSLTFTSGSSGFYRAVSNVIMHRMDTL